VGKVRYNKKKKKQKKKKKKSGKDGMGKKRGNLGRGVIPFISSDCVLGKTAKRNKS